MMIAEIKNKAGVLIGRIKGSNEFVYKSLSTKVDRAYKEGNIVTMKTIPSSVSHIKAEMKKVEAPKDKDAMLTQAFCDWGLWDFGPFNPEGYKPRR